MRFTTVFDPDTSDTWVPHCWPRRVRVVLRCVELLLGTAFLALMLAWVVIEWRAMLRG
jgi:hypothetical protein